MISTGWKWIERGTDLLWPASLELAFAATLLLVIAVAMHLGLLRAAASLQHRVWALTMGGLLLLPLLCPILPKLPAPIEHSPCRKQTGRGQPGDADARATQRVGNCSAAAGRTALRRRRLSRNTSGPSSAAAALRFARRCFCDLGRSSPGCTALGETIDRERPSLLATSHIASDSRLGPWGRALSAGNGPLAVAGATFSEEHSPA